jgi:hypothetical protein
VHFVKTNLHNTCDIKQRSEREEIRISYLPESNEKRRFETRANGGSEPPSTRAIANKEVRERTRTSYLPASNEEKRFETLVQMVVMNHYTRVIANKEVRERLEPCTHQHPTKNEDLKHKWW